MGRGPCCGKHEIKKGTWTPKEDQILVQNIQKHGSGSWSSLPKKAGLIRCGKSCRFRWTNYLHPGIKHDPFSSTEEATIIIFMACSVAGLWQLLAVKKLNGVTSKQQTGA